MIKKKGYEEHPRKRYFILDSYPQEKGQALFAAGNINIPSQLT